MTQDLRTLMQAKRQDIIEEDAPKVTPYDLIVEHFKLDDWLETETKRFKAHVEPVKIRLETIKQELLAMSIEQKVESFRTDAGTAYKSTVMTPSIESREAYLDFVLDNWEACGNEMLQLRAPAVEALRNYMQEHEDQLPPGVKTANLVRMNIKRS